MLSLDEMVSLLESEALAIRGAVNAAELAGLIENLKPLALYTGDASDEAFRCQAFFTLSMAFAEVPALARLGSREATKLPRATEEIEVDSPVSGLPITPARNRFRVIIDHLTAPLPAATESSSPEGSVDARKE